MAQRLYQQFQKTLVKEVVSIYANVPIGATGAVGTLAASKNMGIKSVTRTSAGLYVITLGNSVSGNVDKYNNLLAVNCSVVVNGITAVPAFNVVTDAVAASGAITVQFSAATAAGNTALTATDPASGSVLLFEIKLKNSAVI
jgi:hypothetical protein